jgi:hypothetical protein
MVCQTASGFSGLPRVKRRPMGSLVRKEATHERLVHDHDSRSIDDVAGLEVAPAHDRHAHHVEEGRLHEVARHSHDRFSFRGRRRTFDVDRAHVRQTLEEQRGDGCRRVHAGQRVQPLEQVRLELPHVSRLRVPCCTRADPEAEHAFGLEAGLHALERREAAHEQPCSDEKDQRERDLRRHQQTTRASHSSAGRAAAALAQRRGQRRVACLERRRQAENQTRHERGQQPEANHDAVDTRTVEPWQVGRARGHEQRRCSERDQQAGRAADEAQDQALDEGLRGQASPDAPRRSARQLAAAGSAPREQQIRDVHTRDEQHERDGAEQDQQTRTHVPDNRVAERLDEHATARQLRVFPRNARHDARQLGIRTLAGGILPQPPDH